MANLQGTVVFGPVVPFSTNDIYSTHKAKFGQGGWKTTKDLNERNSIVLDRREDLMIVAVEDNSTDNSSSGVAFYLLDIHHNASTSTSLLDNNNWVLLNFGYGGDGWVFPPPTQSIYQGKRGQRSFDDTYLYICVENNLWKRVAIDWFIDSGSAGFASTSGLQIGDVPIWDGTEWNYDYVVKNVDYVSSTSGKIIITFTDNSTKTLDLNDIFSSTSGHINGQVPIWNSVLESWDYDFTIKDINSSNGFLNITYTNDASTSFKISSIDKLDELLDVNINNATSGEILAYNGSSWINQLFPGIKWHFPVPSISNSTGTKGTMSYDDNFIYICIETNLWKRINIDFFLFSGSTSGSISLPFGSIPVWNGSTYVSTFAVTNIQPTVQMGSYGELITYSNGTNSFISFGTSGINASFNLSDLTDVNVNVSSSSGIGNYLKWDGSKWVNSTLIIPNSATAGNGLSSNGNIIEFGGILTKNTNLDINDNSLIFKNGINNIFDFTNRGLYSTAGNLIADFNTNAIRGYWIPSNNADLIPKNYLDNQLINYIPITGTLNDYPISGDIEFTSGVGITSHFNDFLSSPTIVKQYFNSNAGAIGPNRNWISLITNPTSETEISQYNTTILLQTRTQNFISEKSTISINKDKIDFVHQNSSNISNSNLRLDDNGIILNTVDGSSNYNVVLKTNDLTAQQVYSFPDKGGVPDTIAMLSDISGGGFGTVTSIGLSGTNFNITNSPVTTNGIINIDLKNIGESGLYNIINTDNKGRVVSGTNFNYNNVFIPYTGTTKPITGNLELLDNIKIFSTSGYSQTSTTYNQYGIISNAGTLDNNYISTISQYKAVILFEVNDNTKNNRTYAEFTNQVYNFYTTLNNKPKSSFGLENGGFYIQHDNGDGIGGVGGLRVYIDDSSTGLYSTFNLTNQKFSFKTLNNTIQNNEFGFDSNGFYLQEGSSGKHAILKANTLTLDRTFQYPDKNGTIALTSDIVVSGTNFLPISGGTLLGDIKFINGTFIKDNNNYTSINTNNRNLNSTNGLAIADWNSNSIRGYWTPSNNSDLITKIYLDSRINSIVGESTTAGNGLSMIGKKVELGGVLTKNIDINLSNFSFDISKNSNKIIDFDAFNLFSSSGLSSINWNNRTLNSTSGNIISDWNSNSIRGYWIPTNNADLITKIYLDSRINSIVGESTTAGNGLSINNKTILLGGVLTNNTVVDGSNFNLSLLSNNGNINLKAVGSGNININNINQPKTDGSSGYVMTTDGSGNLSLQNPSNIQFLQTITQTRIGDGINPQTEVSLLSSSSGNIGTKTINGNTLKIGDVIKLKLRGFMNISNTGTFTFNVKLGSTVLVSRSSVVISHPKTNQLIDMDFEFVVRNIGSSGKIIGNGLMIISVGTVATPVTAEFVMPTASTIDTTTSQIFDFTVSWTSGFNGNLNTTTAYIKKEKI